MLIVGDYLWEESFININLYFTDDSLDIPYIDIDTVEELIERVYHEINEDNGYSLDVEKSG